MRFVVRYLWSELGEFVEVIIILMQDLNQQFPVTSQVLHHIQIDSPDLPIITPSKFANSCQGSH